MLRLLLSDPQKTLSDGYAAYFAWANSNRVIVWGAAVLLVILYVFVENWGQPWMEDDFDDNASA